MDDIEMAIIENEAKMKNLKGIGFSDETYEVDQCKLILEALHEKQDRESPEPMTLNELNECNDAIWCSVSELPDKGYWCLCHKGLITPPSCMPFMAKDRPNWTFYRYKPKEANDEQV